MVSFIICSWPTWTVLYYWIDVCVVFRTYGKHATLLPPLVQVFAASQRSAPLFVSSSASNYTRLSPFPLFHLIPRLAKTHQLGLYRRAGGVRAKPGRRSPVSCYEKWGARSVERVWHWPLRLKVIGWWNCSLISVSLGQSYLHPSLPLPGEQKWAPHAGLSVFIKPKVHQSPFLMFGNGA